ncbi:MAG: toll/interleukin-1 receptor domain-containing protein [Tannerellaceae bacterium]
MNQIVCLGSPYILPELEKFTKSLTDICLVTYDKVSKKKPVLYLYFGDNIEDKNRHNSLLSLEDLTEKDLILPVLRDPSNFKEYIPDELKEINAIIIKNNKDIHKLNNRILEWCNKIEVNRKVFISYKRTDSLKLAEQLYDTLIKSHYTPFLDSYSIETGVKFQEYLLHELSDSAIFVFINTPNYEFSSFTLEELNAASLHQMSIIEIKTNSARDYKEAEFSVVFKLEDDISPEKEYPDEIIKSIVYLIEKERAKAFEFKRKTIIDNLIASNKDIVVSSNGIISTKNNTHLYYPVFHNPLATDYQKAEKIIDNTSTGDKFVIYNGIHCRKDVKDHILWLNKSLPIKAIDINE